jgi:DnaJ-class molecular chaperone
MAQTRGPCDACNAEGKRVLRSCRACQGKKCIEREKSLDIQIKPGMVEGEQLTFAGECSDSPEFDSPGDVILTLRRASNEDADFEWKGDDLWIRHKVTFSESILGFTVSLPNHPNGKSPNYVWHGGPLIHGSCVCFPYGGMPKKGTAGFGDLRIQIMIQPPLVVDWTPEDAAKLQSVLGGSSRTLDTAELPTLVLFSAESLLS